MKIYAIIIVALLSLNLIPSVIHYEAPKGEMVYATITAYTSSEDETDEDPWTTAAGTRPGPGTIACPAKWPFGTIVEIEGARYRCEDRMNKRYRDKEHYDIWLTSKEEAFEWGKRELAIYIHQ